MRNVFECVGELDRDWTGVQVCPIPFIERRGFAALAAQSARTVSKH